VKDVSYLGHLVVPNGTAPQDVKVEAITKMVASTDESKLRALLGTYNYYRKFIKNFARKAAPLNRLLQNDVPSRSGLNLVRRLLSRLRLV
jgi:hypothetical protein